MNLVLKLKNCNLLVAPSVALLCLYLMSSCGLGTEVGNGAKEEGKSKKTGTAASNNEGSDSGGDQESTTAKDPLQDSDSKDQVIDYGIDTGLLFNSCGSPFESAYKSPFELKGIVANGSEEVLKGTYDSELMSVTISNRKDAVLAKIKDDAVNGDHKVEVSAKDGSKIASNYTCSAIAETEDNGIYTYMVTMTTLDPSGNAEAEKQETNLTWIVDKTKTTHVLISISVSSEDTELLKLEAVMD